MLADSFNKNSNCRVDKKIQELESDIRRIVPHESKLTPGQLSKALNVLNNRIRGQNLSSAEIQFSRDSVKGENLDLNDMNLIAQKSKVKETNNPLSSKSKTPSAKPPTPTDASPGDVVYVKHQLSKNSVRDPYIVTSSNTNNTKVLQKLRHSQPSSTKKPSISPECVTVHDKFLFKPNKFNKKTKNFCGTNV